MALGAESVGSSAFLNLDLAGLLVVGGGEDLTPADVFSRTSELLCRAGQRARLVLGCNWDQTSTILGAVYSGHREEVHSVSAASSLPCDSGYAGQLCGARL